MMQGKNIDEFRAFFAALYFLGNKIGKRVSNVIVRSKTRTSGLKLSLSGEMKRGRG